MQRREIVCLFLICVLLPLPSVGEDLTGLQKVLGEWTWTRTENSCTEIYEYRADKAVKVISGSELAESRFSIAEKSDRQGFYEITDEVVKDNGKPDCSGSLNGTAIGDESVRYVIFNTAGDRMLVCEQPVLKACFGPLVRANK